MGKGERNRAEREARQIAHAHTQYVEGQWLGEVSDEHPMHAIARELIRRYNDASGNLQACPHLQRNPDQVRFWVESVPELLACRDCTPALVAEEHKRRNSRCLMCGKHVPLRGVSATAAGVLMRCGICKECEPLAGLDPLPGD
jgi:hypothetical protein